MHHRIIFELTVLVGTDGGDDGDVFDDAVLGVVVLAVGEPVDGDVFKSLAGLTEEEDGAWADRIFGGDGIFYNKQVVVFIVPIRNLTATPIWVKFRIVILAGHRQ